MCVCIECVYVFAYTYMYEFITMIVEKRLPICELGNKGGV